VNLLIVTDQSNSLCQFHCLISESIFFVSVPFTQSLFVIPHYTIKSPVVTGLFYEWIQPNHIRWNPVSQSYWISLYATSNGNESDLAMFLICHFSSPSHDMGTHWVVIAVAPQIKLLATSWPRCGHHRTLFSALWVLENDMAKFGPWGFPDSWRASIRVGFYLYHSQIKRLWCHWDTSVMK